MACLFLVRGCWGVGEAPQFHGPQTLAHLRARTPKASCLCGFKGGALRTVDGCMSSQGQARRPHCVSCVCKLSVLMLTNS